MQHDVWIDDNEYPEEKDVEAYGYDSPPDFDPLTIGYVGDSRPRFWTAKRLVLLIVVLVLIAALLLPSLLSALS